MRDFSKERLAVDADGPVSAEHYGPVRWLLDADGSSVGMAWGHTQEDAAARGAALAARWNAIADLHDLLNEDRYHGREAQGDLLGDIRVLVDAARA